MAYLFCGLGCVVGALLRYGCMELFKDYGHWAILAANVLGCFFLGLLTALLAKRSLPHHYKPGATTGFCGGLTTFSSLIAGLAAYGMDGSFTMVIAYGLATVVFCLLAVIFGLQLAGGEKWRDLLQ